MGSVKEGDKTGSTLIIITTKNLTGPYDRVEFRCSDNANYIQIENYTQKDIPDIFECSRLQPATKYQLSLTVFKGNKVTFIF